MRLIPENSHLFAAIGSALNAKEATVTTLSDLKERLSNADPPGIRGGPYGTALSHGGGL